MADSKAKKQPSHPQRGYVLLVMTALILSAGIGLLGAGVGKTVQQRQADQARDTLSQLRNIKQRLLTYAAIHPEIYGDTYGPGYLPCPTLNSNAQAIGSCSGAWSAGWLPRRISNQSLSFEAEGLNWDHVWLVLDHQYAINTNNAGCNAGTSQTDGRCTPLNTEAAADRLTLNGRAGYVAFLIYAGDQALGGQQRNLSNPDIADYLDADNGDGDSSFISRLSAEQINDADERTAFNDIVVPITAQEWQRVMRNRVRRSAREGSWCNGGSAPSWFAANQWQQAANGVCL